ncbi:MAG: hypothetical protein J5J00_15410 [Deltaproteobacteria bacterium]|nr:hypothetical protein [Deltaproteobacteria bacterium]
MHQLDKPRSIVERASALAREIKGHLGGDGDLLQAFTDIEVPTVHPAPLSPRRAAHVIAEARADLTKEQDARLLAFKKDFLVAWPLAERLRDLWKEVRSHPLLGELKIDVEPYNIPEAKIDSELIAALRAVPETGDPSSELVNLHEQLDRLLKAGRFDVIKLTLEACSADYGNENQLMALILRTKGSLFLHAPVARYARKVAEQLHLRGKHDAVRRISNFLEGWDWDQDVFEGIYGD